MALFKLISDANKLQIVITSKHFAVFFKNDTIGDRPLLYHFGQNSTKGVCPQLYHFVPL